MGKPWIRHSKGVSLIELMVALAVLAIVTAIAVPSFTDFVEKSRLKSAANGVTDLVVDARAESVKRARDVSVAFGGSTTAWCAGANAPDESAVSPGDVIPAVAPCDCTVAGSCMLGADQKLLPSSEVNGVTLAAMPSPASFSFDGRTGAVSGLASHSVTLVSPNGDYKLDVSVMPLGQVDVCVPDGEPAIAGYSSC